MSDTSAFGFGKFVPGFDFLQNLSKSATQATPAAGAMPGMASWVAPTLSIEEIDKRIQELKAVQFWLDQNATALKATIQAMEVQKMTLSTLQSMNVNMADLAKAFTAKPPAPDAAPAATATPAPAASIFSQKPAPAPEPPAAAQAAPEPQAEAQAETSAQDGASKPAVDPMQWWGALTQQFQGIAAAAMKDVAAEAMKAGAAAKNAATSGAKPPTAAKPKAGSAKKAPVKTGGKGAAKTAAQAAAKPTARKAPVKKRPTA
ncbi:MAG: PhaM family polyhydroxyalkanoate granule multifunctional regulatory protein [Pseudomonadota bacterium]|jgi:hypothetical protein